MKKIAALLLAGLVFTSMLSGCGQKEQTNGGVNADGSYAPTEEVDVELWYTQGSDFTPGNELSNNVVSKWVHDKTLVNVESIYGNDNGQWDVKLSRLVAGDNLPEIIACGAAQGPAHFAKLAQSDLIWEITDEMLEKYAPNYLKRVPKTTIDMFRIDGKLYGLPYSQNSSKETNPELDEETLKNINEYIRGITGDEHYTMWIRDDILKMIYPEAKSWDEIEAAAKAKGGPAADLCFDIPITTTQEYIDFMYKIKDLNLTTEGGKPVYAIGYSGGDNWEALCYIGGDMMGYSPNYYTSTWRDDIQEIVIPLVTDVCKEAARIQNRMVRDKVIDPESLVHTTDLFKEKALNGQYVVFAASYVDGGAEGVNNALKERGASYRIRPFNVNIPNLPEYQAGKGVQYWEKSMCFTKKVSEEELIQLLNWVNVCCSEEFDEVYWWGTPENGLYTEENGVRRYVDDRFNKRFIDGDVSALDDKDTKGIGVEAVEAGVWYVNAVKTKQSGYAPPVYNKTFSIPVYTAVTKIESDSPHTVKKYYPQKEAWSASMASIPEVVQYWAQREKWENAFKIAFTASSDEDFEAKWQSALDTLNSVVDVKEMERKMTEVARAEYATLQQD